MALIVLITSKFRPRIIMSVQCPRVLKLIPPPWLFFPEQQHRHNLAIVVLAR